MNHFPSGEAYPAEPVDVYQEIVDGGKLSRLDTVQLADYHFAVAAVQMDGKDVFLSTIAHKTATRIIGDTHHDLVVASADAITRELLPGGGTINPSTDATHDPEVIRAATDPTLIDAYGRYIPDAIINRSIGVEPQEAVIKTVFGMRRAAQAESRNPAAARTIATDIARLSSVYFAAHRRMESGGRPGDPGARGTGWLEYTSYLTEFIGALDKDPVSTDSLIQGTRLINAVHDGQSAMVQRFSHDYDEGFALLDVLDAAHEAQPDRLLKCAGYAGGMLHQYIIGRSKSLTRLPSDRAVPAQFTHLQ